MTVGHSSGKKCYNCASNGITSEHAIPKFLLSGGEQGLTVPCCESCRSNLHWLDDYAAIYFLHHSAQKDSNALNKFYRECIIKNGSPLSPQLFGADVVINEGILFHWIHKICVGIAYSLYGELNNIDPLHATTNFSKLGGYSPYNNPNNNSLDENNTAKFIKGRNLLHDEWKKIIDIYGIVKYEIPNAMVSFTQDKLIHGARWFRVVLYKKFSIICSIANSSINPYHMIVAKLPVRIKLDDVENFRVAIKSERRGDSLATILAESSISEKNRALRKARLEALGVLPKDIEYFENSLTNFMENEGGKELLAERILQGAKTNRGKRKP